MIEQIKLIPDTMKRIISIASNFAKYNPTNIAISEVPIKVPLTDKELKINDFRDPM